MIETRDEPKSDERERTASAAVVEMTANTHHLPPEEKYCVMHNGIEVWHLPKNK